MLKKSLEMFGEWKREGLRNGGGLEKFGVGGFKKMELSLGKLWLK